MMTSKARVLGFAASSALTACGGSSPTLSSSAAQEAGAMTVCTPGASVACTGPGGCAGGQVCNANGSAFGACDCGSSAGTSIEAGATSGAASAAASGASDTTTSGSSTSGTSSVGNDADTSASGVSTGSGSGAAAQSGSSSGSTTSSGGIGEMSGASAACVGAATQACGNCNGGSQVRTCDNGVWSAWSACSGAPVPDLGEMSAQGGVGMGNFTISFDFTTLDGNPNATQDVVNQRNSRPSCGAPTGNPYWDIQFETTGCNTPGSLQVQHFTQAEGVITHCTNQGAYNFGTVSGHHITIHRANGQITMTVDTTIRDQWTDATDWDAAAVLAIGTDVCDGINSYPVNGTVSNVCVEKQ
jgi:hypothetical protein